MHYRQLMTLDIGNDELLCKVFPASLQGQALSWFHRLPPNSVDNFRDLSEAFVGQYLCSARHKQNISTLQNIKMRDNESLREFVKRFGQAVLQIEACSMDAVLQIFKRSICPGTPFFESLAKSLLQRWMTCSEGLINIRCSKMTYVQPPSKFWLPDERLEVTRKEMPNLRTDQNQLTGGRMGRVVRIGRLSHPYPPIEADPSIRDRSKKCAFHKDHGHTTETCRSLQYLVERLIKAGHLKQYLRSDTGGRDASQHHNSGAPRAPAAPKAVINYINGGPSDEEYDSRRKRQKLLRAASIRERINSIRPGLTGEGLHPIDGTIIFPPAVQLTSSKHQSLVTWDIVSQALRTPDESCPDSGSSTTSLGDIIAGQAGGHSQCAILGGTRVITLQCHPRTHMAPLHESHPFHISPNAKIIRVKWISSSRVHRSILSRWLANVVVVPKKEGKWRIDYTNLNNACPKDSFPLPRIDQIVDSTSGQGMLSFLDAFSGYHQIPMYPGDQEKTAFITPHGLYCYKVMPFGLKNAGATYQRLMTTIFKPLIGHTVEVYIDDIVVKSKDREEHVLHLQEVFHLLRRYGMKLNPSKCAFGVSAGKFLGFMVSQRGIEVSPDQVKAVMETPPPKSKKELQRLTCKLVVGRFIARFLDELRPFFRQYGKLAHKDGRTGVKVRSKKLSIVLSTSYLKQPHPTEKLYMYLSRMGNHLFSAFTKRAKPLLC
ncbi:hypothetical protein AAG906_022536 [Vitis piasezkii]